MDKTWTVYIIETELGTLYTGITTDMAKRFKAHTFQKKGARYFRLSPPKNLVYQKTFPNRSEATKHELALKKLTRSQKLILIKNYELLSSV